MYVVEIQGGTCTLVTTLAVHKIDQSLFATEMVEQDGRNEKESLLRLHESGFWSDQSV